MLKSLSSINSLVVEYNKTRKEFMEKSQNALKEVFKAFFDQNPDIDQITWNQYTPYFNDGDECIFGVHDMYFTLAKDKVDLSDVRWPDDDGNCHGYSFYVSKGEVDPIKKQRDVFSSFAREINRLPNEVFKDTFGDHVKIVASKNGFDVEEFQHD